MFLFLLTNSTILTQFVNRMSSPLGLSIEIKLSVSSSCEPSYSLRDLMKKLMIPTNQPFL